MSQMDLEKRNEGYLIGLFGRVLEKQKEGFKAGVEPEVIEFSNISDILNEGQQYLNELRRERNTIADLNIDGETKKEMIDNIISIENQYLKAVVDNLASMDIDFIFDQTVGDNIKDLGVIPGLTSAIFGTAEDAFKPNPREK